MIVLTKELIETGGTNGMGFNQDQFNILGVSYPPKNGWKDKLIGKQLRDEDYQTFLALKGMDKEGRKLHLRGKEAKPMNEVKVSELVAFMRSMRHR